jgi:hypothetical protein
MTDMPGWRSWADAAHRDSLRTGMGKDKPRYRYTACQHRTSAGLAKKNGWNCFSCKAPFRAKEAGK